MSHEFSEPSGDALVTDHAALRFLQRQIGLDIGHVDGDRRTDREQFLALCKSYGIDPSVVRDKIASPEVRMALKAGAHRVYSGGVWVHFKYGKVASILTSEQAHTPPSIKANRRLRKLRRRNRSPSYARTSQPQNPR